jgi:hypothetical protein
MTKEDFVKLVNSHDLTYGYSDDPRVYRMGSDELSAIRIAAKEFDEEFVAQTWNAAADEKLGKNATMFYWRG